MKRTVAFLMAVWMICIPVLAGPIPVNAAEIVTEVQEFETDPGEEILTEESDVTEESDATDNADDPEQQILTDDYDLLSETEVVDDTAASFEYPVEESEDVPMLGSTVNVSGTVYASNLNDNDGLNIKGDTTLIMDVEKTLLSIWGDYDLVVKGDYKLTLNNPRNDGINVNAFENYVPVEITAARDGVIAKGGNSGALGGRINIRNSLVVNAGRYGVYNHDGSVYFYSDADILSVNTAVKAYIGDIWSETKLTAYSKDSSVPCIDTNLSLNLKGESVITASGPGVIKAATSSGTVRLSGDLTIWGSSTGGKDQYCIDSDDKITIDNETKIYMTGKGGIRANGNVEIGENCDVEIKAAGDRGIYVTGDGKSVTFGKGGNLSVESFGSAIQTTGLPGEVRIYSPATLKSQNGDTIHIKDRVRFFNGASIKQAGSGYGIMAESGNVTFEGSQYTVEGGKGIKAVSGVFVAGADVNVTCNGGEAAIDSQTDYFGRLSLSYENKPASLTVSGAKYGILVDNIASIDASSIIHAKGNSYAMRVNDGITLPSELAIVTPAGGKVMGTTVVSAIDEVAKEVLIKKNPIPGTVSIKNGSEATVGDTLSLTYNDIPAGHNVHWQKKAGSDYNDIPGATEETYVVKPGDADSTIRARVTVPGYTGEVYSGICQIWAQPKLSGNITYSPSCSVGIQMNPTYNLTPSVSELSGKLHYFWQLSASGIEGYECETLNGENAPTYTPKPSDAGKYIRAGVKADGYRGVVYGSFKLVKKQLNTSDPATPKLTLDPGSGYAKVTITNAKKDQEYVLAYPESSEIPVPDWTGAVHPSKDGNYNINAQKNKRVIVFTRMRETDVQVAGTKFVYAKIFNGQAQELQDIELSIREVSPIERDAVTDSKGYVYVSPVEGFGIYQITANSVPEAADFEGIKLWKIDGNINNSSVYGKFYTTKECTTPINPTQYYKTVYYKPAEEKPKNYLKISASNLSGTISDTLTLIQGTSGQGGFVALNIIMPEITIRKGRMESGFEFINVIPELSTIGTLTATKKSGEGTAPVIYFHPSDRKLDVNAIYADAGTYTYSVTDSYGGNVANDLVVTVEAETCKVILDPGEGSGSQVEENIPLGSQFILPGQPDGFTPKSGCIFDGWDKGEAGEGIIVDGPVTITARWKAHTHKMTHFPAFDPTCISAGNIAYYKCTDCSQMFSDKDGLNPISDPVLPATGHSPVEVRENEIPADEEHDGSYDKVEYCSNCGDEISRTHIPVPRRILEKVTISAHTGNGGFGLFLQNNNPATLNWKDSLSVDPGRYSVSDYAEPRQGEDSEDSFYDWGEVDPGYVTYNIQNKTENDSSLIFSKLTKENCTLTVAGFNSECVRITPYVSAGKSSVDIVFKMTAKKEYAVKAAPVSSTIELSDDGSYLPPAGQDIWLYDIGTKNVKFSSFSQVSDNPDNPAANVILTGPGAEVFEIKKTLATYPITITPGDYGPVCTVDVKTGLVLKPNFVYTADLTLRTEEGASVTVPLSLTVTPPSITGIWMEDIPAQDYTGSKITPAVKVYWGEKLLSTDDYSVSYSNNTNAYTLTEGQEGFNASKAPSVTVKGKGNYKGTFTKAFVIEPANLTTQAHAQNVRLKYTGRDQKPTTTVTATLGGKVVTLKAGKDYEYEYAPSGYDSPGPYNIPIRAKSTNFTGSQSFEAVIIDGVPVSKASVSNIANIKYDGTIHHPTVTVKCGGKTLVQGVDYKLEYNDPAENYRSVGKATVTIRGTENVLPGHETYFGTVTKTFNITGTSLSGAKMETMAGFKATVPYSGTAIEQDPATFKLTLDRGSTVIPYFAYDVKYENNINAGTAKMIITGRPDAGYTGQLTKTFKITGADMASASSHINVYYTEDGTDYIWHGDTHPEFSYNLGGVKPELVVRFGIQPMKEGKDYTVSWANNTAVKTDLSTGKIPTLTIKGKGNFAGSTVRYFKIGKKPFNDSGLTVIASDVQWQDKAGICNPAVTVLEKATGKVLKAGTDYYGPKDKDHPFEYVFAADTTGVQTYNKITKAYDTVNAADTKAGKKVEESYLIPEGTRIKVIIRGKGAYTEDDNTAEFKYVKKELSITGSAFKITIADKQWTGAPIELTKDDITVTYKESKTVTRTLKWGQDFEIVPGSYINNIDRGTAKVTIRALNHGANLFGGTKQVSFKIVPRRMNYAITYNANETGLMYTMWNRLSNADQAQALAEYNNSIESWYEDNYNYRITGTMKGTETPYGGKMTANAYKVQKYNESTKKWVNVTEAEVSFKGWGIKDTGSVIFSDKAAFTPSWMWRLTFDDSVTLYAIWK
ncbi:MAG: hypothetical protein J5518_05735 [Lachnospiraceae bacterium]|nr:hypothetical protein [Lachnospiraceae bacterium]